jgi:hypothetical protein
MPEHTIPSHVYSHETTETNKSVAHEGNTTTLGSSAEECEFGFLLTQLVGVELRGVPRGEGACVFVVLKVRKMDTESGICLNDASIADL